MSHIREIAEKLVREVMAWFGDQRKRLSDIWITDTHEIIGRMMKCVTDETLEAKENGLKDTAALKQQRRFQRLRTNFGYREPEKH